MRGGLLGSRDRAGSRDGVGFCTDGFRAGRATPGELRLRCARIGYKADVVEVDESSVFCRILKNDRTHEAAAAIGTRPASESIGSRS